MNIDTGEKTWLTPPHIIEALGPFDLDPCCPPTMPWHTATRMVHWPADGLKVDWTGKRVWCNPPYGREAIPFLRKMAENRTGGVVFCLYLRVQTLRRGRTAYFLTPTASCSFADDSAFAAQTERPERRLRRPLRSSHTPNKTLTVSAQATLQAPSCVSNPCPAPRHSWRGSYLPVICRCVRFFCTHLVFYATFSAFSATTSAFSICPLSAGNILKYASPSALLASPQ